MKRLLSFVITIAVLPPSSMAAQLHVPANYPTIQAAIDQAAPDDEVVIAPGRYTGTGNRDLDFLGKRITVRGTAPTDPEVVAQTVIDCQKLGRAIWFQADEPAGTVVEGLSIVNGSANQGAAIYSSGTASPTIRHCNFQDMDTNGTGGALLHTSTGALTIENCQFISNTGNGGGAIAAWFGTSTVTDCLFLDNSSNNSGGAIWTASHATSMTISDCQFVSNEAEYSAGAVHMTCNGSISNCRFIENSGRNGGGLVIAQVSTPVTNCVFSGNEVTREGGAIYVSGEGSQPSITHCTISHNKAETLGGALRCLDAIPSVTNSILRGNTPDEVSFSDVAPAITYSNIEGGWADTGNFDLPAMLAMDNDPHLLPGSPCIDAGTNTPPGGLPTTDLEGKPRSQNGDNIANAAPDMGAYETAYGQPCIAAWPIVLNYYQSANGPNPPDQTVNLRNCGAGTLSWTAVESASWVEVLPASGTSSGESVSFQVRVDATGLQPGDHDARIEITDSQAANSPRIIRVLLHVGHTLNVPSEYPTIRSAILAARDGDQVVVADGVYTGNDNRNLNTLGKAITVRSENGPENCIIDCQGQSYAGGFIINSNEGPDTVVDGFTIQDTTQSPFVIQYSGPTIRNCHILWTTQPDQSPAISCQDTDDATIENCRIKGFDSFGYNGYVSGSGIVCDGGSVTITGCHISGMITGLNGGGIYVSGEANVEIANSLIEGNTARDGGGIHSSVSTVTITGTRIEDNTATDRGGGLYSLAGSVTVENSYLQRNDARYGGGIALNGTIGAIDARTTVLAENQAQFGGGIYVDNGSDEVTLNLTHCTIVNNKAVLGPGFSSGTLIGSYGGGISCNGGELNLWNSILWGNEAAYGASMLLGPSEYDPPLLVNVHHCDVDGGEDEIFVQGPPSELQLDWGESNIDRAPSFAFADDYHLLGNSACVDVGSNSPPGGLPDHDIEGNPRAVDGKNTGSAIADMGAFEYNPQIPVIAVSPQPLDLQATQEDGPILEQELLVRNAGGGVLNWTISEQADWLGLSSTSGQSSGEIDDVTLQINLTLLSPGTYETTLTINDPTAGSTPTLVPVELTYNSVLRVPEEFPTIQAAIDATMQNGDVVIVGDGTWTGPGNKNIDLDRRAITLRSANGPDTCIIDCENDGTGIILECPLDSPALVEGFTITRASNSGIINTVGSSVVRDCRITHSTATEGGGIHVGNYSPIFMNCVISDNTATGDGGGVFCNRNSDAPVFINCDFLDNEAGGEGGGVADPSSADPAFRACRFIGNTAADFGGGLLGGRTIEDCLFEGNRAVQGGALFYERFGAGITGCTFRSNRATDSGGAIASENSDPVVVNCLFEHNHADYRGGAILVKWPSNNAPTTLENCTLVDNSAGDTGGGLYIQHGSRYCSAAKMRNAIVWNNTAPAGAQIGLYSDALGCHTLAVSYSDVQGGEADVSIEANARLDWESGNLDVDPLFVDAVGGDFHLTGISPCIDTGDPASAFSLEPQPDGGRINMGTYGNTAKATTQGSLVIRDYVLVRKTRVGRTEFEYEYAIEIENAATNAHDGVQAEIAGAPSELQIVDGTVSVGTVGAGQTLVSTDTFTFRLDRATDLTTLPISWYVIYSTGTAALTKVLDVSPPLWFKTDLNGDGVVDGADLVLFEDCVSGPAIPVGEGCGNADFDEDNDADQADFGLLQRCLGNPEAAGGCE